VGTRAENLPAPSMTARASGADDDPQRRGLLP